MRTFLLSMAGAFAAMVIFVILAFFGLIFLIGAAAGSPEKPTDVVLSLDLRAQYSDQAPTGGLNAFSGTPGFIDIVTKIKAAETDDNVKGIFIRGTQMGTGSSRAEELRDALHEFREAGKFVIAHSQGTYTTGPSSLRAISAADEIWIQPGTDLIVSGVSFETLFMKGLLDNLSIVSEVIALYEYKNSPNQFQETDYTEAHREAMLRLAESIWQVSLEDISADRDMDADTLRSFLEAGPMSAEAAVDRGILDTLGWPEEAREAARTRDGEGTVVPITSYTPPFAGLDATQIAIIGGQGGIVTGSSQSGPFSEGSGFASDTVAGAILRAGDDEKIKAIVFRVDSGGGSPTASDQIWRAIEQVQEKGKPVVVSMGSVAASGGYYVSTGADHIMANRTTITGSIGIYGGKQTFSGLMERIGVNPSEITVGGEYADAFGSDLFTQNQEDMLRASLTRGYERFTSLVAEGRGMTQEDVHEIAKGRVWSGEDAMERGLVDEIGGFTDAVEKALSLTDAEPGSKARLIYYPKRKQGLEALEEVFGASAEVARAASILGVLAGDERLNAALENMHQLNAEHVQVAAPIMIEN